MANIIIRYCQVCGKDISHKKSKKSRFCSVECTSKNYRKILCSIDGCNRFANGKYLCQSHQNRLKNGNLYLPIRKRSGITSNNRLLYARWRAMINRCTNKNIKNYRNYGGRGIMVCERWKKFDYFIEDMGIPTNNKLSIDRIDNNGNYEPSNCRWATIEQQSKNTRIYKRTQEVCNKVLELRKSGKRHSEIIKETNISKTTLYRIFKEYVNHKPLFE